MNTIGCVAAVGLSCAHSVQAGSFSVNTPLNTARAYHTATLLRDGTVLVAGGLSTNVLATAERYHPDTRTWASAGSMHYARQYTATLMTNGNVLVAGGSATGGHAQIFYPATGTWSNTASLKVARGEHTATLLPNSTVLLIGGYNTTNAGNYVSVAEYYDPIGATWTRTDSLNVARADHTATLLLNGQVLVAGGDYGNYLYLSSTELYASVPTSPTPFYLTGPARTPDGAFQFTFTNTPGLTFSVFGGSTLSASLSNWTPLAAPTETAPGSYSFSDTQTANHERRFYRVTSP